MAQPVT
jgi:hypothetical protein